MMLTVLDPTTLCLQSIDIESSQLDALKKTLWIDLLSPSEGEKEFIRQHLDLNISSRLTMKKSALSNRLYHQNDACFMTFPVIDQSDPELFLFEPITFVLTKTQLLTIRYIDPVAFTMFGVTLQKYTKEPSVLMLFVLLLETTVRDLAHIFDGICHNFDDYSSYMFDKKSSMTKIDYNMLVKKIGAIGHLNTKTHECLVELKRLIEFFIKTSHFQLSKDIQLKLSVISADIHSLDSHAEFYSNKINFLLDATLGMINMISIEQNDIIKMLSIVAVVFLPPTLIASIYGMNFPQVPELTKHGFWIAVGLIMVSAWMPYKYFKRRKWL